MTETAAEIRLFDPATLKAPYEAYRYLRDHEPVYYAADLGVYVITRYDLIRQAIKDTETFSSRFDGFLDKSRQLAFAAAGPAAQEELRRLAGEMEPVPPTMLTLDEPDHTRYRSLVSQLFTGSRIKQSQPAVQAVIDERIDAMAARAEGAGDFMREFAFPVPLAIIAERLGIPPADRPFFDEAATAAAAELRLTLLDDDALVHRARLALDLQRLLIRLVEERRQEPTDDMISILATSELEDEKRRLTHGEIIGILNQFLVAGHETTSSTFGWGMLLLCRQPELQRRLAGDQALIRTFVEEALRLEAPVQGLPRLVTRDLEFGGAKLSAGDMVMLRFGAGNRDERQFPLPDEVDLEREKAGMQLAFGSGVHHCIGAPLARQELNLGFEALLDRFEDFTLDDRQPPPEAEASFILRNLPELHVRWSLRG